MNQTSSLPLALVFAVMTTRESYAQQRYAASGERLLTVTRRVPESEGDRHSLRTRIQEHPISRSALRCAALPAGEPFGVPVPMTDGTLTLVTRAPTGLAWFADGTLVRHITLPGNILGTAVEGADGRVIVVDDSPAIRSFSPDGTPRTTLPLPAMPMYGASVLNDGTLIVPLSSGLTSDLAVVSADLTQQTRLPLAGLIANRYFYRGHNGSLWFNTQNSGPFWISGDRPTVEPLAFARTAVAAWQLDEDTIAVQFGTDPAELRWTSRDGVTRASVPFLDQIFLLPRGHLALAQQVYVSDSTSSTSSAATSPTIPSRTATGRARLAPLPTHTELVVYDRHGRPVTRALLPLGRLLAVLLDPDDSALVFGVNGHAYSIDPGGTIRWDADLGVSPTQDVIALAEGGFAMTVLRPRPGVCTVGG